MLILSLSFFNIEVCYHDISSMRTYLVEVHGTLLQTLVNLMNDYSTNLLLYKDGIWCMRLMSAKIFGLEINL